MRSRWGAPPAPYYFEGEWFMSCKSEYWNGALEFGEFVRNRRKELGLSQQDLAGFTMALSTLSRIENGIQIPEKKTFYTLMKGLGMEQLSYENLLYHIEAGKKEEIKRLLRHISNGEDEAGEHLLILQEKIMELDGYDMEKPWIKRLVNSIWMEAHHHKDGFAGECQSILEGISKESVQKIQNRKLKPLEQLVINCMAVGCIREKNYDAAIFILESLFAVVSTESYSIWGQDTDREKAVLWHNLSIAYLYKENYKKAVECWVKTYSYAVESLSFDLIFQLVFTKIDILKNTDFYAYNLLKMQIAGIYTFMELEHATGRSVFFYLNRQKEILVF